jgi:hypothetical protein
VPSTGSSGGTFRLPGGWSSPGKWSSSTSHGGPPTPVNPDFKDLFAALNAEGADYLLVSGYAMAVHDEPRFTKDLDVWVNSSASNPSRVHAALGRFGASLGELTMEDLATPGIVFQIGVQPNRIDLLTAIDGVTFEEAWPHRLESTYGAEPVHVIGRRHLVKEQTIDRAGAGPARRRSAGPLDLAHAEPPRLHRIPRTRVLRADWRLSHARGL